MKLAILGAGFTGLAAAYRLSQQGHQVTIFEKENALGGLAVGFSKPDWSWTLERGYHHWFTNDYAILNLAKNLNHKVVIKRPSTDVLTGGKTFPLDSPLSLLMFPYLSILDRLRVGLAVLYLKMTSNFQRFEGKKALDWIRKWMGEKATQIIWDPLLEGKFGQYKNEIALTWFWARIKKRTPKLAYPEGGFKAFADKLGQEIKRLDGKIFLGTEILEIQNQMDYCLVKTKYKSFRFDKVIVTLPSPIFAKVTTGLPKYYVKRITSIPHLHAQVLMLVLKKPFLKNTYWLNITDKNFPFLVLAEHTNFMDPKYYGGQHILYIGNYLPTDHPYLKMTAHQLLKVFDPYLRKINPNYKLLTTNYQLFIGPFAQPVVTTNYPKLIPQFKTPLKNIYLANLDMVYPWDRGTNYAVEMGEKIADMIDSNVKD